MQLFYVLFKSKITNVYRRYKAVLRTWVYTDFVGVTDTVGEVVSIKRYFLPEGTNSSHVGSRVVPVCSQWSLKNACHLQRKK